MSKLKHLEEVFRVIELNNETLSLVESCTGGRLSQEVTSIAGASKVYCGGLTPYQDEVKSEVLGIDASLILEKTAVSSEVVLEMAKKGCTFFKSSWCLATSGWAGPEGGTSVDPVGTVYFAVVGPGHESVERRTFSGSNSREEVVEQAVRYAWEYLSKVLQSKT